MFDEADALFGARSEIEGSDDRWSNLEVMARAGRRCRSGAEVRSKGSFPSMSGPWMGIEWNATHDR